MTATTKAPQTSPLKAPSRLEALEKDALNAWKSVAPFWPLKHLIAVNPLQGFEDLPFEKALLESETYFEKASFPLEIEEINRETIKWLCTFFDEGQASLAMPLKSSGLFSSWKRLIKNDKRLHKNRASAFQLIASLPNDPLSALSLCLSYLGVTQARASDFFTLVLLSLPGWASYIKYLSKWSEKAVQTKYEGVHIDYLALRLVTCCLLWPEAKKLLDWQEKALKNRPSEPEALKAIQAFETSYRGPLLDQLSNEPKETEVKPEAQLVFCIDVRSEGFRRAIESVGPYETLGFAGFFGVPARIKNERDKTEYNSCPVLLQPKHEVIEKQACGCENSSGSKGLWGLVDEKKTLYQSVICNFSTPYVAAEFLGLPFGLCLGLRTLAPKLTAKILRALNCLGGKSSPVTTSIDSIPFEQQCSYAEGALTMMGLVSHFAPLVIFCGHGSTTVNNAYGSSLDCGACGGHSGEGNARILAKILNEPSVRKSLKERGIVIPDTTRFMGAKHDTTTDELVLFEKTPNSSLDTLKKDLKRAKESNTLVRLSSLDTYRKKHNAVGSLQRRSEDWSETRPEWGLARNAAFIVGPRSLTQNLDLESRCFLHSYDYTKDPEGTSLTTILTAPMVVAQWINSQYLFSTLNNTAFGAGSKITKNIAGKIGTMQGNASDLMTGLSLQSVYAKDEKAYHEPQRLMCVVYAPKSHIDPIVSSQEVLQKLFGGGWVELVCIEPKSHLIYVLQRDFTWKQRAAHKS